MVGTGCCNLHTITLQVTIDELVFSIFCSSIRNKERLKNVS